MRNTPCPNCKESNDECACLRNKCVNCGKSIGNITFTVCDDCWNKYSKNNMKTKDKEKNNILSITQIKIVLPGKTIEFSSEEARKVYEELGKLFKMEDKEKLKTDIERLKKLFPEKEKEYIPYYPAPIIIREYIERPHWQWNIPWCQTQETTNFPNQQDITYQTNSTLAMDLTNNIQ